MSLSYHNDKKYAEYDTVYVLEDISFHNFFWRTYQTVSLSPTECTVLVRSWQWIPDPDLVDP